jgi:hypothetical protein
MLSPTVFLSVLLSLVVIVPRGITATKKTADLIFQDRPLLLSTTRSKRSDGKTELKLKGRYKRADKVVELRGLTIKGARRKVADRQKPKQDSSTRQSPVFINSAVTRFAATAQNQGPAPMEGGGDPPTTITTPKEKWLNLTAAYW